MRLEAAARKARIGVSRRLCWDGAGAYGTGDSWKAAERTGSLRTVLIMTQRHPSLAPSDLRSSTPTIVPPYQGIVLGSLLPQCHHGIELHCASRWEITGCGSYHGQQ